jgi:hypothetical protein
LAAQRLEVSQHPRAAQTPFIGDEERGSVVGEPTPARRYSQQRAGVGSGVAQPCCRARAVADERDDLVVEILRAGADRVPVSAPALISDRRDAERGPELELGVEDVLDGAVIPLVPELAVEGLDQPLVGRHRPRLCRPP